MICFCLTITVHQNSVLSFVLCDLSLSDREMVVLCVS